MTEINNTDNDKDTANNNMTEKERSVNESTGIYIRGFIKITDPETGEVLVHTAD